MYGLDLVGLISFCPGTSLTVTSLIPVGGILTRLDIKSPWMVRIHAPLQSLSFVVYVVAVAIGVWLVKHLSSDNYSLWDSSHIKLGIVILAFAAMQPILGIVHHRIYKRMAAKINGSDATIKSGRTAPGIMHMWLGRILIIAAIVNGGLGLDLAAASPFESSIRTKAIAYGIGATVMCLLYLAFCIASGRRRMRAKQERTRPKEERPRNIPLIDQDGVAMSGPAPPVYKLQSPPSYEQSQHITGQSAGTATRYT